MQAGNLNHYITITKPGESSGYSSDPGDPVTVCTVWANKKGISGRNFYAAAGSQAESEVIYTIRFRKSEDVKAGMDVIEGGHAYRIYTPPVDVKGTRQWLELHCKEVVPDGS